MPNRKPGIFQILKVVGGIVGNIAAPGSVTLVAGLLNQTLETIDEINASPVAGKPNFSFADLMEEVEKNKPREFDDLIEEGRRRAAERRARLNAVRSETEPDSNISPTALAAIPPMETE